MVSERQELEKDIDVELGFTHTHTDVWVCVEPCHPPPTDQGPGKSTQAGWGWGKETTGGASRAASKELLKGRQGLSGTEMPAHRDQAHWPGQDNLSITINKGDSLNRVKK